MKDYNASHAEDQSWSLLDMMPESLDGLTPEQYDLIRQRVAEIEHMARERIPEGFESKAREVFSKVPTVDSVYIVPELECRMHMEIVHDADTVVSAIERSRPHLNNLEDAFPGIFIEKYFLHKNEFSGPEAKRLVSVFSRES